MRDLQQLIAMAWLVVTVRAPVTVIFVLIGVGYLLGKVI